MNDLQFWVIAILTFLYGIDLLADVYYAGKGGRTIERNVGWYVSAFFIDGLLLIGLYFAFWRGGV